MDMNCDVLVIGAGPAGSIAASTIKKANKNVIVVEKTEFPRFVIGESLLPSSMHHFESAGFLNAIESKKFEKKFGARFIRGNEECLFDFSENFTPGWRYTYQVPRADFDKVMADEVEKSGVPILYNTEVVNVNFNSNHSITTIKDKNGSLSNIKAKFLIDASGYGRVLPRLFNLDEPSNLSSKRAFFTHVTDKNRPEGREGVQITFYIIQQDVWFWVIPFSNGNTSLGFVGNPEFFQKFVDNKPETFYNVIQTVRPDVASRFKNQDTILQPQGITNYSISTNTLFGNGFALAGNATEFLDPVFSSGVGFATESGYKSACLAVKQLNGEEVNWEKEYAQHMMQGINTFRTYIEAWYDGTLQEIFFSSVVNQQIKKQICSVLAGYVWDVNNPFVKRHDTALKTVLKAIRMELNHVL
jgi:flavin-dependent dehydrogenase